MIVKIKTFRFDRALIEGDAGYPVWLVARV